MRREARSTGLLVGFLVLATVACAGADIVINEIAWAGTAASANDEWIELHNTTDADIDLTGWVLRLDTDSTVIHLGAVDGDTTESRRTVIEAGGYFLLERTDDTTVSDVEADLIYKGTLSNAGMLVELIDAEGDVVDFVDGSDGGWPAGRASDEELPYATMERDLAPEAPEWIDNNPNLAGGLDADGQALAGTPRAENSVVVFHRIAPTVRWTASPRGAVSGRLIVEWAATDPDGPNEGLQLGIAFSPSDGSEMILVADQLVNGGSYALDTTTLPDGPGRLAITATDRDGYSSTAMSEEFEIRNAP